MSETYLYSSAVLGDGSLEIPGYSLERCGYSFNTKCGDVYVYYKSYLKSFNVEFSIGKTICRLISLYKSPSQNQEEFNTCLDNLESNLKTVFLSNPFLAILIGDFNAKCASWYSKGSSTTEASKLRLLTSQFVLNNQVEL